MATLPVPSSTSSGETEATQGRHKVYRPGAEEAYALLAALGRPLQHAPGEAPTEPASSSSSSPGPTTTSGLSSSSASVPRGAFSRRATASDPARGGGVEAAAKAQPPAQGTQAPQPPGAPPQELAQATNVATSGAAVLEAAVEGAAAPARATDASPARRPHSTRFLKARSRKNGSPKRRLDDSVIPLWSRRQASHPPRWAQSFQ